MRVHGVLRSARVVGVLLVVATLAGCSRNDAGSGAPPAPPVPQTPAEFARALQATFDEAQSTRFAVEALSRAGVEVYDDATLTIVQPPSGRRALIRLTRFQARNMALEAAAGGGIPGSRLDAAAPRIRFDGRAPAVTLSNIVAAWAVGHNSFGATLARELLGPIQPGDSARARFPVFVLALFLADAAPAPEGPSRAAGRTPHPGIADLFVAPLAAAPGVCADAQELLNSLDSMAASLQQDGGFLSWAGGTLARLGLQVAVEALRAQLAVVRTAMAAAAAVMYGASLTQSWALEVQPEPDIVHYGVGAQEVRGAFVARVIGAEGIRYPEWLRECAALTNITLPEGQKPDGLAVEWTTGPGFDEHANPVPQRDTTMQRGGVARFPYVTAKEDASQHQSGTPEQSAVLMVSAELERQVDPADVARLLGQAFNEPTAGNMLAEALGGNEVRHSTIFGFGTSGVRYHQAGATFQVVISGPQQVLTVDGYNCSGVYGTWNVKIKMTPGGEDRTTFTVSEQNPSGTFGWSVPFQIIGATGTHTGNVRATVGATKVDFSGTVRARIRSQSGVVVPVTQPATASVPISRSSPPECRG